jgi:UDP-N-acetylglucosamine--N-acetylmuramyl-(pentapeptide) pyrophosphoryl-undecaprenol N-acetylglucosamine transferase
MPSILIPYPYAADDHQYANAQFLAHAGAGIVFRESTITAPKLRECLDNLFNSPERLHSMATQAKLCARPDALSKIVAALKN